MNADKLVIGLTGMPGSGKSLVVEAAKKLGYAVVTMGDVIREETAKRGLELNPANVGKVMLELRAESGDQVIAKKCIPKILQTESPRVMVDGLRSYAEAEVFKAAFAILFWLRLMLLQGAVERLSTRAEATTPSRWMCLWSGTCGS
jgi:dephospho-CoA kinase